MKAKKYKIKKEAKKYERRKAKFKKACKNRDYLQLIEDLFYFIYFILFLFSTLILSSYRNYKMGNNCREKKM